MSENRKILLESNYLKCNEVINLKLHFTNLRFIIDDRSNINITQIQFNKTDEKSRLD